MATTAKELALKGCDNAFEGAVEKIVMVLGQEILAATNAAGRQKALDAFKRGIEHQKSVYDQAVAVVSATL